MSLSFVTKAIQTTAADGTFEEQAVENDDDKKQGTMRSGNAVGLFDQLRQNKDEEEAARLEFQRSIMRGTLALDEDDAAHLQELQRQKEAESKAQMRYTETQLASFRAAQAERFEHTATGRIVENQDLNGIDSSITLQKSADIKTFPLVPNIKIKKRRRRDDENNGSTETEPSRIRSNETNAIPVESVDNANEKYSAQTSEIVCKKSSNADATLSSLLSGYSSDEDV